MGARYTPQAGLTPLWSRSRRRHAPLVPHGPKRPIGAGAVASSGKGWGGGSLGAVGTGGVMVRAWDSWGAALEQLGPSRERTAMWAGGAAPRCKYSALSDAKHTERVWPGALIARASSAAIKTFKVWIYIYMFRI